MDLTFKTHEIPDVPAIPGCTLHECETKITLESGKKLKIQANGDKVLEETVPDGKRWETLITVSIREM